MTSLRRLLGAIMLFAATAVMAAPPADVRRIDNLRYGADARQRMDVYLPDAPRHAPILLLVHGGAWMVGNEDLPALIDNKVAHWVKERGFIVVSADYRMVPQVDPLTQARDVAAALAAVQAQAGAWGGDAARVVLMGHSAGAHLVALLSAEPALAFAQGARPWLGTVVLDSAAIDTVVVMSRRHLRFYDRVFGADPAYWQAVSPTARLARGAVPTLVVCSTLRGDDSCGQSEVFVARAQALGLRSALLPQALDHKGVNAELGLPGAYTRAVDAFIDSVGASP